MKTKLFTIILFATVIFSGISQNTEQKTIVQKDNKGIVQSIEYSNEDTSMQIPKNADEFFNTVLKIQTVDSFEKKPHISNRKEYVHEHFDQYYNGIKVVGAGYNFHYLNEELYFAHGHYIKFDNLNTKPSITKEDAKSSFANYKNIPQEIVTDYIAELILQEIPIQGDTLPMLVYKTTLNVEHANNNETGFIDAHTGKVILTESFVINFEAIGTFATLYSGSQTGITHFYNGAYHLVDSTAGRAIIHTWNHTYQLINNLINF
jgi:hypothetical protein